MYIYVHICAHMTANTPKALDVWVGDRVGGWVCVVGLRGCNHDPRAGRLEALSRRPDATPPPAHPSGRGARARPARRSAIPIPARDRRRAQAALAPVALMSTEASGVSGLLSSAGPVAIALAVGAAPLLYVLWPRTSVVHIVRHLAGRNERGIQ